MNAIVTRIFDVLLAPLAAWPALALVASSIVAGLLMTVVFRWTSPQRRLRRVAARSRAMLLCLRLFKDDFGVAMRAQGELFLMIVLRLAYALPPMVVLAVPFVIVLAQLAARYEHRPLAAGEAAIVEVAVRDADWEGWRGAKLVPPPGASVETPALRDEGRHTLSWRIRAAADVDGPLRAVAGDASIEKRLRASTSTATVEVVADRRGSAGVTTALLHPAEAALEADGPVLAFVVRYPPRATPVFGVETPWWLTFLVGAMVTALVVRPVVGVQF